LKKYKSPGIDLTLAELIQLEGETLYFKIYKPVNSTSNKKELPQQWKESLIVPLCKNGNKTDCSNYKGIPLLSTSYKISFNILLSRLSPLGIITVGFDITDHLLIRCFAYEYVTTWRKYGRTMRQYMTIHRIPESP
jgi:hypothetical protein